MYSEKATKFCEISTLDLFYVVPVKSTVEVLQNFVALSEYMNFTFQTLPKYIPKMALAKKNLGNSNYGSVVGG